MTSDRSAPRTSVPVRVVAAVVVGNALEFYDFLTYAFFAVYIGRAFFPAASSATSLLESLATFGVGFVTRPIGGWVIGRMGDRAGRKPAMILSFSLMGVAIAGLALTPPRSMIGIAAPILVILFRMLQGFAVGGEVGPTTAFLLEVAPPDRRGFYTAFQFWTQDVAVVTAGLVGFALANIFTEQGLESYGWRIAFLAGTVIVPFGLKLRLTLPETFRREGKAAEPTSARPYLWVAFLGLVLLSSGTIGGYITEYMTTYAIATLHMQANVAFAATAVVGLCGLTLDLVSGALSDVVGRKPMMVIPGTLLLLAILPVFHAMAHYRTPAVFLGGTALLSSLIALSAGPTVIWLTESFPAAIRSSGVAIVYAGSLALFGGTTQYFVTWLIKVTENPQAPAWCWTAASAVGLAAMIATRESAPRKTAKPKDITPAARGSLNDAGTPPAG
jgi:MFS transporter, MHS family, citrate/tricarballylate:H+ symporter